MSDSYEERLVLLKASLFREYEDISDNFLKNKATTTLLNYMRWKCRKWKAHSMIENSKMRQSLFLTYIENNEIICKICAKNVIAKNIKEHSLLCKSRAENILKIKEKIELLKNDYLAWLFEDRRKISLEILILK